MIGFIIGTFAGATAAFFAFCILSSTKEEEPKPPGKKLVYIASAYRGDKKRNLRKAARYTALALKEGVAPITPHLFYSTILNDDNPEQRQEGMEAGLALLRHCDELWVFGEPSEGMKAEIIAAQAIKIPVRYHSEAGGRKEESV